MICEWDDFGCNHVISDQCQSHDCRDKLLELKKLNPKFKTTLFAIPGEMTADLTGWCQLNKDWVEVAVHGFFHQSNYECAEMIYEDIVYFMQEFNDILKTCFVNGFRAPGWQISDDWYKWLKENEWWVADQGYNDSRRPKELKAYVNYENQFRVNGKDIEAYHGHTWDVGWNGIYEDWEKVVELVKSAKDFKFISELFK